MSKTCFNASVAASSLLAMAVLPATPAFADSDNAAAVIRDEGCTGFIPTADGLPGPLITTTKGHHRVVTSSGVAMLSCHFDIPRSEAPPRPRTAQGFKCRVDGVWTNKTTMLVSPGGRGLLVCKINGK